MKYSKVQCWHGAGLFMTLIVVLFVVVLDLWHQNWIIGFFAIVFPGSEVYYLTMFPRHVKDCCDRHMTKNLKLTLLLWKYPFLMSILLITEQWGWKIYSRSLVPHLVLIVLGWRNCNICICGKVISRILNKVQSHRLVNTRKLHYCSFVNSLQRKKLIMLLLSTVLVHIMRNFLLFFTFLLYKCSSASVLFSVLSVCVKSITVINWRYIVLQILSIAVFFYL